MRPSTVDEELLYEVDWKLYCEDIFGDVLVFWCFGVLVLISNACSFERFYA